MAVRSATRHAGSCRLADGSRLTWTVADGRRGRRWRTTTVDGTGASVTMLLLELDPDGRPSKVEMATGDGLLSLHPETAPAALHGNVVRAAGVEHVTLPWSADHILVAAGSPVTAAAAASLLAGRLGVGEGRSVPAVVIEAGLMVRRATWRVARLSERRWRLLAADGSADMTTEVDDAGVPVLDQGATWPLELDPAG